MGLARKIVDKDEDFLRQLVEEKRRLNDYIAKAGLACDYLYEVHLDCNSHSEIFYCTGYRYLDDIDMFRFDNYTSLDDFNGMTNDGCLLVTISNINFIRVKRIQKRRKEK